MRSTLQMRRAGGFTDTSASFGLARRSAASTTSWIDICAGCLVPSSGTPGGRLLQTSCFGCSSTARAVRLLCGLGHPGHGLCYLSCWCLSSIGCIWRPHARYTTTRATPPHNNGRSAITPANPPHDDSCTPTTQYGRTHPRHRRLPIHRMATRANPPHNIDHASANSNRKATTNGDNSTDKQS